MRKCQHYIHSRPVTTNYTPLDFNDTVSWLLLRKWATVRVQLNRDGTRWHTGGEVKGKLANGVGSQYSSHYLGTWCIQHYYRWCAHNSVASSRLNWRPCRFKWTRPFRRKTKSGFCACAITFQTQSIAIGFITSSKYLSLPLLPKFAGSNPAEAVGFLRVNKNLQHVGGHGCLSVVIVVCCQVEVSATGWSLVQRSPTDCGASLCVI